MNIAMKSLLANQSPEPTAVGTGRSAGSVHSASRRWLSFFHYATTMRTLKSALIIALGFTLTACTSDLHSQSSHADSTHASREAALEFLRQEGILSGSTRVESAVWHEDVHEWLITLQHPSAEHPSGIQSYWFVDAAAKNYQGGTCTQ
jgi:hypothetical protein